MSISVSVIIPALNEERLLPGLLEALKRQSLPPLEIIVADAGSRDGTVALAEAAGARVVLGGKPAAGRNAGAAVAQGELLLFLDSDVLPPDDFIEKFIQEFDERSLDVATAGILPNSDSSADWLLAEAVNTYLELIQRIVPHAGGYCILAKRSLHEAIGGFDESLALAEDHNYVQRAARVGKFGMVTGTRLSLSMRRLEKEGVARLALMYLYSEIYVLAGKPIRTTPFQYEFGNFDQRSQGFLRRELEQLRQQISQIGDPLKELSEQGRQNLRSLANLHPSLEDTLLGMRNLPAVDISVLRRYVKRRQRLLTLEASRLLQEAREQIEESQPAHFLESYLKPKNAKPGMDEGDDGAAPKPEHD